jgi:hypothetical protein
MRKIHELVYGFIFTILTLAVFLVGCGGGTDALFCDTGYVYCTFKCCLDHEPYLCNDGACKATAEECVGVPGGLDEVCGGSS